MRNGLPAGWATKTLGEICSKPQYGWTSRAAKAGQVKYVRTTDISNGKIDWERVPYCEEVPEDIEKYRIKPDDILVSRAGSVGVSFRIAEVFCDAIFASYLIRFKPLDDVQPKWVEFFLKSDVYWRSIDGFTAGIAIPNVNASKLASLELPLPPLPEQRRIVAKLEKLLANVDTCRQRLAKIPALLKRFRQSVLAAACSGRLTADWREKSSSIQPVSEVIADAKFTDDLPTGWAWCAFGEYVENHDGKRIPVSAKEREKRKGAFPYYGASGVIDSIDGFTHEGEFVLIGEDGANLLSRSTPIAFIAKGQIWVNNHAHVLKCKRGFLNAYLAAYINSIDLSPYVTGTAQPKLNQANMNTIPVPAPPLLEQQEIVRRVESLFTLADQSEARCAQAKARADNLTQSILAKAFRGELLHPTSSSLGR